MKKMIKWFLCFIAIAVFCQLLIRYNNSWNGKRKECSLEKTKIETLFSRAGTDLSRSNATESLGYYLIANAYDDKGEKDVDVFTVEFKTTDNTTDSTYWCLSNFYVDVSEHANRKKWRSTDALGGYGGLQNNEDGLAVIFSMWQVDYVDANGKKGSIKPKLMTRASQSEDFDNEGSGVKYIDHYEWKPNTWYRWVLRSWDNKKTGSTWFGTWIEDLDSGEIEQVGVYDTQIYHMRLTDNTGLFLEDFEEESVEEKDRTLYFRNIYSGNTSNNQWYSKNDIEFSVWWDLDPEKHRGTYKFDCKNGIASMVSNENGECLWDKYGAYYNTTESFDMSQPDQPDIDLRNYTYVPD